MTESTPSTKIGFGAKNKLSAVLASKQLDAFDLVCFDNQEFGWIDKFGQPVISTPRTQTAIKVNGVEGLGIANGTEIPAGQSFDDIIKMLVQKRIPATYDAPTIGFSGLKTAQVYEVGSKIKDTLTATFNKKDGGNLTSIKILSPNNETLALSTVNNTISTGEITITVGEGSIKYFASAEYAAGAIKKDNFGNESPEGRIQAGTCNKNVEYKGARKIFFGSGNGTEVAANNENIRALNGYIFNTQKTAKFNIILEPNNQWAMFAIPSSLNAVPVVKYIETNDANCLNNFAHSVVKVNGANGASAIDYNVYLFKMATPAEANMTFEISY